MLALSDPLWKKLDDAHRDRNIPLLLSRLAQAWDDEAANSLFWDCLCHQGTCYGATYAAIPHLLEIAQSAERTSQRLEIALFAGYVALRAFDHVPGVEGSDGDVPQGLPQTLEGWDRKLDVYRRLVAIHEDPARAPFGYEKDDLLPRCRRILATEPVDARDLEEIHGIRRDFFESLPDIRSLCERAFRENLGDEHAPAYLLGGMAAADGLIDLARLLDRGPEGDFRCPSCGWQFSYILFGDRIAVYADDSPPGTLPAEPIGADRTLRDFKDGSPSRSDGVLKPLQESDKAPDTRIAALLDLAELVPNPTPALLLRAFLGSFVCTKCHVEGSVTSL